MNMIYTIPKHSNADQNNTQRYTIHTTKQTQQHILEHHKTTYIKATQTTQHKSHINNMNTRIATHNDNTHTTSHNTIHNIKQKRRNSMYMMMKFKHIITQYDITHMKTKAHRNQQQDNITTPHHHNMIHHTPQHNT